ncbi:MAG: hypothetical protein EZS28_032405 [Streblomastix strix]|uniref:Uncharacterized protein n=1 Tax=Streblomastix strix TaxID=222440 RepID=A0A5J4UNL7_9EUKA|nr:MAG: hypothetical protein EZS28_032405 [Streblomastix strix]
MLIRHSRKIPLGTLFGFGDPKVLTEGKGKNSKTLKTVHVRLEDFDLGRRTSGMGRQISEIGTSEMLTLPDAIFAQKNQSSLQQDSSQIEHSHQQNHRIVDYSEYRIVINNIKTVDYTSLLRTIESIPFLLKEMVFTSLKHQMDVSTLHQFQLTASLVESDIQIHQLL